MSTYGKSLALFLLFFGEFFGIYMEMTAAHLPAWNSVTTISLWKTSIGMTIAGLALLSGYYIGYKVFQSIWIVTVVSVTSILIIEPILAYLFFHELPNRGSLVGLIFGSLGLLATILL